MTQLTWRVEWLWRCWTFGLVFGPEVFELHLGPLLVGCAPSLLVGRWAGLVVDTPPWEHSGSNLLDVAVEPIGTLGVCHHCTKPILTVALAYQIQTGERFCNEQCVDDWRSENVGAPEDAR